MHDSATVPTIALDGGLNDPDATLAVLDQEVLENLRDLPGDTGGDLLDELITLFAQEAPPRIAQLRDALQEGEAKRVMQVAHSLKGSSANLGATCMAGLCNELELRGHDANLDGGLQVHDQLVREYRRVQMALELERSRPIS